MSDGGEIRPSTASAASKDGGKETHATADESHLYVLPEHRTMHRTVSRNLRKREAAEPWMLETTTAPEPGQNSVAEDVLELATQVDAGKAKMPPGLYVNWRQGGPVKDWGDDDEVRRSLGEAYEHKPWVPTETIFTDDIRAVGATEADSRRYWLNQMHKGSASAFDLTQWNTLAAEDRRRWQGARRSGVRRFPLRRRHRPGRDRRRVGVPVRGGVVGTRPRRGGTPDRGVGGPRRRSRSRRRRTVRPLAGVALVLRSALLG